MPSIGTFRITLGAAGDTLLPLNTIIHHANGDPVDLSLYTVTFVMEEEDGDAELAETATGVTAHPTQAFTVDATTEHLKCNAHGVQIGDVVIVASTTTLPAGLTAATRYFATDVSPDRFKLEAYPGAGPINITDTGTGTHTFYVVGSVQMDFAAANVDTAGIYRGWFITTLSAEKKHWPEGDSWYTIQIVNRGN